MRYIHDPQAITRHSMLRVQAYLKNIAMPDDIRPVAGRIIHACGTPAIARKLVWHGSPALAAQHALQQGAVILSDSRMSAVGIDRKVLPADNKILCWIDDVNVAAQAKKLGETRSAMAVEQWRPHLSEAVVVIGNAPTALFRLLEIMKSEGLLPAAIFAFPVGFIGAAQSKRLLIKTVENVPYITLPGQRGGSAIAAAAINAVCRM